MADIPLKDRRIQFNAPNANGGNSPAFRANVVEPQPIGQAAHKAGQNVMSTLEVFQKIKRQNDIARATNDLAVYKKKVSDLMNSTEIDPDTGEVKGFLHKKGENAFNSLPQYQDKLSALTKEYQQQIYKYDPDIRDKFTIDSDGIHLEQMNSINSYALNETEKFQMNASEAYFSEKEKNTNISSPEQFDIAKQDFIAQEKLINPGQSDEFYNYKADKHCLEMVKWNVRRLNEQDSQKGAYLAYQRGANLIRNLIKSKRISKEEGQKELKEQQILRFNAVQYEGKMLLDDFISKINSADGMDKYEKLMRINAYAKNQDRKSGTGTTAQKNEWIRRNVLEPKRTSAILGVELNQEQLDLLPSRMLALMPFVKTATDKKTGRGYSYLDREALSKDKDMQVAMMNTDFQNAANLLETNIMGAYKVNGKVVPLEEGPLPALTPDEYKSFISELNTYANMENTSKQRVLSEFEDDALNITNKISKYEEQIKAGQKIDVNSSGLLSSVFQLRKKMAENNLNKKDEVAKIEAKISELIRNEIIQNEYGDRGLQDVIQEAVASTRRYFFDSPWWRINDPDGIARANDETADKLQKVYFTNGKNNMFGPASLSHLNNDTMFEALVTLADADASNPLTVAYNMKDSKGNIITVEQRVNNVAIGIEDIDKANVDSMYKFLQHKTITTGTDWFRLMQTKDANSLSNEDKALLKTFFIKSLSQQIPGLIDANLSNNVSVAKKLSGKEETIQEDLPMTFITKPFWGITHIVPEPMKAARATLRYEQIKDTAQSEMYYKTQQGEILPQDYKKGNPLYIQNNRVVEEKDMNIKIDEIKNYGGNDTSFSGIVNINGEDYLSVNLLNKENKKRLVWVKVPRASFTTEQYKSFLADNIGNTIYIGKEKYSLDNVTSFSFYSNMYAR